jgi:hypothetical protein
MGLIVILLVLATGVYGAWHSVFAAEFTARDRFTGRAKYQYQPKRYERLLHLVVSVGFLIAALINLVHLWKSN